MEEKGSSKYDSLMGGNVDSQYQTVPVQPAQQNLSESKTFALQEIATKNSSDLNATPHIQREETEKDSMESKVVGPIRAVKIGVTNIENGENSMMISPIVMHTPNVSLPSGSKIVDDSFG